MRTPIKFGAAMLPLVLALAGCSGTQGAPKAGQSKSGAAVYSIYVDSSGSTAMISSAPFAEAISSRAADEVMHLQTGDSVNITSFGTRTLDNAVPVLSLQSGYNLRLPAVRKRVAVALHDLMARNRASGGQPETDMTYALEQSAVHCTSSRDHIVILSDGLVENEQFSMSRALASGQPIHMPPPTKTFLNGGCTVEMLGVGMAPGIGLNAQTLPNNQVVRLEDALRAYFRAAGASDVSFTSVL